MQAMVEVMIYNTLGQRVRILQNQNMQTGWHTVTWDGRDNSGMDLCSGIYIGRINICTAQNPGFIKTVKMVKIR
jgi:flagellar hook assembly protein FlgD